jgi:REP-associated tyrosine transposase
MPRMARRTPKGWVYHALNRAVARLPLFQRQADYEAFERVLAEVHQRVPLEILAYCVMPNHWHFVLRPTKDGQLTEFLRRLAHTHTMRWHAQHHTSGTGHLYQGRFKAFPVEVEDPAQFHSVARYVEGNALRAGLVAQAQAWRWSSLWRRGFGDAESRALLARWPVPRPRDWVKRVNAPQTEAELEAVRRSVRRGSPFGNPDWQRTTAQRLGLQTTLRPRGRPRKSADP